MSAKAETVWAVSVSDWFEGSYSLLGVMTDDFAGVCQHLENLAFADRTSFGKGVITAEADAALGEVTVDLQLDVADGRTWFAQRFVVSEPRT